MNGFTDGINNTTVTVQQGATSGAYVGRMDALEATVTYPMNTLLMGALNGGQYTLSTKAVAVIPACVYGMNTANSTASFSLANTNDNAYCPIYVNQGLSIDSNSYTFSTSLNVVGSGYVNSGRSVPLPAINEVPMTDPLANVVAPVFSGCSTGHTSTMNVSGGGNPGQGYGGLNLQVVNLTPGTYCGGFNISSAQLNFAPGLYIITGGMTVSNSVLINNPQVTSPAPDTDGVTLYFTQGGGYPFGTVTLGGNSSIVLSAPTASSGADYAGILFFFDRSWSPASSNALVCSDAYFVGDGIWYGVNSVFAFDHCSNASTTYFGLIANSMSFTNNVYASILGFSPSSNFSNLNYGNPFRTRGVLAQ